MTNPESGENFGLRQIAGSLEEKNNRLAKGLQDARNRIQELSEQLERLSQPPSSYATFLSANHTDHTVIALVGNRKMLLSVAQTVELGRIEPGQELLLNAQMVVIGVANYARTGEIVTVSLVLGIDRALVKVHQDEERIVWLGGKLRTQDIRVGDLLLADLRIGFALEKVERPDVEHLLLEEIPDVDYSAIGGLSSQIEQIRDTVELPFEQPQLYRDYGLTPPKGVLLYGPPGNGKTLIAKAVATSLAQKILARDEGGNQRAYFLNIKGPQLLDKYVGETERQIRDIFSRARDRAAHGIPVVIFFDEMEALFRTRGSGISSDVETTVVPQLLAEIDGVEKLNNVIVIGASNREDMIDPAILRPGRLDIKIRIDRPDRSGAKEILLKYLLPTLPIHASELRNTSVQEAVEAMAEATVNELFAKNEASELLEITFADGSREKMYVSDLVSGSMLAAIVDRAKKLAIKDYMASGDEGISTRHMLLALAQEIRENEDFSNIADPHEWARVNGHARGKKILDIRSLVNHEANNASAGSMYKPGSESEFDSEEQIFSTPPAQTTEQVDESVATLDARDQNVVHKIAHQRDEEVIDRAIHKGLI
ncbi:proteasome-associated ATPase [Arcanobacterium pluranimalium]|uniref:proteasome ATPase n=1 Tax=Arcanobacterium pluranimalium TaxID=108028 RepID=UPI00195D2686|nr:proteasome ATPase [Arcanobacterium pluranimalium]MBM7825371.1 proteasome-associated ATPase [Arcanobacterium pluranimalium]